MNKSKLIFLVVLVSGFGYSCSNKTDQLILENEVFSKTYSYQTAEPGSIKFALVDKSSGHYLNIKSATFFECIINNQKVSSLDNLWTFHNHTVKELGNGGTEHCLEFVGTAEPVNGLKIFVYQQLFPNSSLIRERLELSADSGKHFTLHKRDNKLHFIFPSYTFSTDGEKKFTSTEIRLSSWERKPITFDARDPEDNQNHMYYPEVIKYTAEDETAVKGPINIIHLDGFNWITTYEHASQDNLNGILDEDKISGDGNINDAMQGTKGIFNFPIRSEDFRFIEIRQKITRDDITVSSALVRGGYLDGEIIDSDHVYSTVWYASAFDHSKNTDKSMSILRDYMLYQICENPASRIPEFYYNTWGMQRTDRTKPLRGVLNYERIFEEIDRAAELGVDIFVLDDGWEQAQGDWTPHKERLNKGLAPIKERLDQNHIKLGVWLSPMGIDSTTERFKEHPEWVIKDSEGIPILAQWNHPAFDFVSGFFDIFVKDCKKLIDEGVTFFKFDAINTFYSTLPNLRHGSDQYTDEELRARYEYLLPIYVTEAMEILTDYNPDVVIEIDVTEARRVMMGLAPISQGKIFHMNNGASGYNDYSDFRANSMRTIPNVYGGIVPLELFTYANYPHNLTGSLDYNVNTSLIAGHGFWGDLSFTTADERKRVAEKVAKSKVVLPFLTDSKIEILGDVGDSPEIYSQINVEKGAGQIIAFSQKKLDYGYRVMLNSNKILAILNHSYKIQNDTLSLNFQFQKGPSTTEAFIFPGNEKASIISSTSSIDRVTFDRDTLVYYVDFPGTQIINWEKTRSKPTAEGNGIDVWIETLETKYQIKVTTTSPNTKILITEN